MSDSLKKQIKKEKLDYEENVKKGDFNEKDVELKIERVDVKEELISESEDFQIVTNYKNNSVVNKNVEIQQELNKSIDCKVEGEETAERNFMECDTEMKCEATVWAVEGLKPSNEVRERSEGISDGTPTFEYKLASKFTTSAEILSELTRMEEVDFSGDSEEEEEENDFCEIEQNKSDEESDEDIDDHAEDPDFQASDVDLDCQISQNIIDAVNSTRPDDLKEPTSTSRKKNSSKRRSSLANEARKKKKGTGGQAVIMPEENLKLIQIDGDFVMGKNKETKWYTTSEKIGSTKRKNIVPKNIKTKKSAAEATTPIECFKSFFTPELLRIILEHTNEEIGLKKEGFTEKNKESSTFKTMQAEELDALLSIFVLSGATKNNHLPISKLFDTTLCGQRYVSTLSRNRFRFLSAALRFDDRTTRDERKANNRFALISEIWDIFIKQCNINYEPSIYVCVDEQLVVFRGRCPFKMYMPGKPNKYGIKILLLCDQATRYMINAMPYLGKGSCPANIPASSYFTKTLVKPVVGSNRNLTAHNWFTSLPLAEELLEKYNLTYTGTIKKNKPQLPIEFTDTKFKNRQPGSSLFIFKKDVTAVSYMPKKNKLVTLISTLHDDSSINEPTGKPEIIINYNQTKGAVDAFDQMCQYLNCGRKTKRWPVCIFYNMINMACINAYVVYQYNFYKINRNTEKRCPSRLDFMLSLAEQLSEHWMNTRLQMPLPNELKSSISKCLKKEFFAAPALPARGKGKRTYCSFCSYKKQRKSKMVCESCNEPVCGEHHKKICPRCEMQK